MSAAAIHPRLAAKRSRARRIRRSAVALTVALFIAIWAVIFGTLVTGHDPALGSSSADGTKASAKKSTAASSSSTSSYPSSSSSSDSSSGSSSSSSAPSVSTHSS